MLRAALFGVLTASVQPITLSGDLDATASSGTATSSTRTVTVPSANSGEVAITFVDVGTVGLAQYSKNGGAFTSFSSGDSVTFANGDTIALRSNGNGAGESRTFTLTDVTKGSVITTAVHTGA